MGQAISNPSSSTKQDIRIYIHGYPGAGRKSILERLKVKPQANLEKDHVMDQEVQRATKKNITMLSWDLGGRCYSRVLARQLYAEGVDVLIYVLDSVAFDNYFIQAHWGLSQLLREEDLKDTIFLVLANKQDLRKAVRAEDIADSLDLSQYSNTQVTNVMGCSAKTGEGIQEAMDWLAKTLEAKKSKKVKVEMREKEESSRSFLSYMKGGFQTLKSMVQKSG